MTYDNGYYTALEELANWLNSLDSGDMTTKQVRKAIYHKILEMRPKYGRSPAIRQEAY